MGSIEKNCIDVNGENYPLRKMKQDLIDEEDLNRLMVVVEYCLVLLEPRCFSPMMPSMPKGEIFRINTNDTIMGSI